MLSYSSSIKIFEYTPYLIILIFSIIFCIYAYLRMKYGFWYYQPVFHTYDFKYYFYQKGIIMHDLPEKNKYTNFKDIETFPFEKLKDFQIQKFVNFVQNNYYQKGDNQFMPKIENIVPYFKGHNTKCFFTFYNESILLQDLKLNTQVKESEIIGVITSRPLHVSINNGPEDAFFDVYYVDYLCVGKNHRKKGTAPQIIQTHEYNQRHINKNIAVSLFKREGQLTGIVPICVYNTYCFPTKKWNKPSDLHSSYSVVECNAQNTHHLLDFIKENSNKFDICITSSISNILELIKSENIYIYFIINSNKEVLCSYFLRKTCTTIENNLEALNCFSSVCGLDLKSQKNIDIFIQGFKIVVWKILEKNKKYGFLVVENSSHNNFLINNIIKKTKSIIISPTAYFFYNFVYATVQSNKFFILN